MKGGQEGRGARCTVVFVLVYWNLSTNETGRIMDVIVWATVGLNLHNHGVAILGAN